MIASTDTAAVNKNSTDCMLLSGKLRISPTERLKIPTILPTKRVSWLTSAEIRVVSPATGFARIEQQLLFPVILRPMERSIVSRGSR